MITPFSNLAKLDFQAMGTDIYIEIVLDGDTSSAKAEIAIEKVKNVFYEYEKIFSRFRPDSELSKINRSIGEKIHVSDEMFEVLGLCLKFNEISQGYFDPRIIENLENIGYSKDFLNNDLNSKNNREIKIKDIPGDLKKDLFLEPKKKTVLIKKRIDTTGIAKGYTVDRAAELLRKEKISNFIIDAGGDMYAKGFNKYGGKWKIGIEGLDDKNAMLKLKNEGIATSGISRKKWKMGGKKFHHLINPKRPRNFSWELESVTVIKEKTVEADGRAKVLFLMGGEKGLEFANRNNLKALFLCSGGEKYFLSEAIKNNLWKT